MLSSSGGGTCFLEKDEDADASIIEEGLPAGPDCLIAFTIGERIHIETFHTVKCTCGTLFVTEEEMEKHL